MLYLQTFFWCIPSPLLWVMNAELWVIYHALKGAELPWLLALMAAGAQTCTFVFLFFAGDWVTRKIPRLRAKLDRFDVERYRAWSYTAFSFGAVTGAPPHVLLAILARSLHARFVPFFTITAAGRVVRFFVLAYAPETLAGWFGVSIQ